MIISRKTKKNDIKIFFLSIGQLFFGGEKKCDEDGGCRNIKMFFLD